LAGRLTDARVVIEAGNLALSATIDTPAGPRKIG